MTSTHLYGGAAELWHATEREVLCDAGARTGKSFSLLAKAEDVAETYAHSRQLFARRTRRSLTTTILPDWEAHFCPLGHHAHTGEAKPATREQYAWPNGATIDVLGLDQTAKVLSGQWDRVYVFQTEELEKHDWETLLTRLSWGHTPYHQAVADVNPDVEGHWINARGDAWVCTSIECGEVTPRAALPCEACGSPTRKIMRRIRFVHEDNPWIYDHELGCLTPEGEEYMATLNQLTGVRRQRLLLHKWVSAEGLVWEEYDRAVHLVNGVPPLKAGGDALEGCWFVAGFDWGWRDAACLQVWAVRDETAWRIREGYFAEKQLDWWVEKILEQHEDTPLSSVIVSAERPDIIAGLNQRLGYEKRTREEPGTGVRAPWSRDVGHIAVASPRGKAVGIDQVKWALSPPDGRPRMFLVRDAHIWGVDRTLRKQGKPVSAEEEIGSYVWLREEEGARKPHDRERPDPTCEDHAMDVMQWIALHVWKHRGLTESKRRPKLPADSYGSILDHERVTFDAS